MRSLFLVFFSCMAVTSVVAEPITYTVHAESFIDEDTSLSRHMPLFIEDISRGLSADDLEGKNIHKKLARVCSQIAIKKAFNVVPQPDPKALTVRVIWEGSNSETVDRGSSIWCNTWDHSRSFLGLTTCASRARVQTIHAKSIVIGFFQGLGEKQKKVHEIRSWMTSDNGGFKEKTAEVLCRGAFQDFPKKLDDEVYGVEIE